MVASAAKLRERRWVEKTEDLGMPNDESSMTKEIRISKLKTVDGYPMLRGSIFRFALGFRPIGFPPGASSRHRSWSADLRSGAPSTALHKKAGSETGAPRYHPVRHSAENARFARAGEARPETGIHSGTPHALTREIPISNHPIPMNSQGPERRTLS